MPRYSTGRTKVRTKELIKRANNFSVHGINNWIDPFPLGFGTLPEKMVYQALSRRGIPFYYLNNVHIVIPEISLDTEYQADFILPQQMIIIEVQGAHWHSMEVDADALKFALYQQAGYKPLAWWDFDIYQNLNGLFAAEPSLATIPVLATATGSTELAVAERTKTDTSKGIRTLNKKRAIKLAYRKQAPSVKYKKSRSYGSFTV